MHGQYLSAGWPLDRRGGARPHGGTAGGPTGDSEAAARNRRAPVRQHQAMDEPGYLSPAWAGEGTGRIQPDGAGLQFHPHGEHRGRRDPPQSGVKEAGRFPAVTLGSPPRIHLAPSRSWRSVMRAPGNGDRSSRSDNRQMPLAGAFPHGLVRFCDATRRGTWIGRKRCVIHHLLEQPRQRENHAMNLQILLSASIFIGVLVFGHSPAFAQLSTVLLGGNEASDAAAANAGDPGGSGTATVLIRGADATLCYAIVVTGIDTPTLAHIHEGATGSLSTLRPAAAAAAAA